MKTKIKVELTPYRASSSKRTSFGAEVKRSMKHPTVAAVALALVTVPAFAECPGDTLEIIAMVTTGGVYCLYDSARDMLDDYRSELNQLRSQGEAALNSLSAKYANDTTAQEALAKSKMDRIQQELRELIEHGKQWVDARGRIDAMRTRAHQPAKLAASMPSAGGPRPGLEKEPVSRESQPKDETPILNGKKQLEDALRQHEEVRNGPFAQAGAELDKLTSDAGRELKEGFQTSLFGPLTQIIAGFPPPDPAALAIFFAATRIKLTEVQQANADMIRDVTARYADRFAAQQRVLDDVIAMMQADLDRARKIEAAMEAYSTAATPANKAQLDAAIGQPVPSRGPSRGVVGARSHRVNPPGAAKATAAAQPLALIEAWTRVQALTKRTLPTRWSAAKMMQMTEVARADVRRSLKTGAGTTTATSDLEKEARSRFANDPTTRDKVIAWIRNEISARDARL
jgi:hypothetical protein